MEFPALETFPMWPDVIKLAAFTATAAWAWTEGTKWLLVRAKLEDKAPEWLWQAGIRVIAVALAVLAGWWLSQDSWGVSIGFIAGVFNAGIVAFGKKFLREKLEDSGVEVGDLLGGKGKSPEKEADES